jgi:uncharacterized DUF497 family protein
MLDRIPRYIYNVYVKSIRFIWDQEKSKENCNKHGISFEEAKSVFYDQNARLIFDPDHSASEDRFVMIGMSNKLRVLIVCHCYREKEEIIRIISARRATMTEARIYERRK